MRLKYKRRIIRLFGFGLFLFFMIVAMSMLVTILYPIAYKEQINTYADEFNVDPFLIAAIINVESKYDKDAVSSKEAKGLMQIGPQTGTWGAEMLKLEKYDEKALFDPSTNIRIGAWYINQLNSEFKGNLDLILAAYNAGSGNVNKWLKDTKYSNDGIRLHNIPFKETDNYLNKVKHNYKVYKLIYRNYISKPEEMDSFFMDLIIHLRKYIKQVISN